MIDRTHDLSIARQAKALNISRGSVYYQPRPVSAQDLNIMRRIDELHLEHPFMGARMLRDMLNREGVEIGRRHVATLMKRMRIEAIYRRPNTSKPEPGNKIHPYLLRGLKIEKPNHVWAMDITYIPMARGFRASARTNADGRSGRSSDRNHSSHRRARRAPGRAGIARCSATIWMEALRRTGRPIWRSRRGDDCRAATVTQAIFS